MPASHSMMVGQPWNPLLLALVLISASIVYARGWLRIRSASPLAISFHRAAFYFIGLAVIWIALGSPLSDYDHKLLTAHMVQHLLLMTFAPALILLSDPVPVLCHNLPESARLALAAAFRRRLIKRIVAPLSRLRFALAISELVLVVWHIPLIFNLALRSNAWHTVEQAAFLMAGFVFWWPVIRPWPGYSPASRWPILLYLFFATLPCDVLSAFLVFSDRVAYSQYLSTSQPFGLTALADQQLAGALMWTCVTIVYLVPATVITTRLLSTSRSTGQVYSQTANSLERL